MPNSKEKSAIAGLLGSVRRMDGRAAQAGLALRLLTFRQIVSSTVLGVFVIWTGNQLVLTRQRKAA